jgi:hypothetical protein
MVQNLVLKTIDFNPPPLTMRYLETLLLPLWWNFWFWRRGIFFFLIVAVSSAPLWAGGGPENVFLVVNPQSSGSMTIANYYLRARQIPPSNVFYLPWDPNKAVVEVDDFRKLVLKPIFEAIHARRLLSQIDYVVYSSDLPYAVQLDADLNKFKNASIGFKIILHAPSAKEWKTAPEAVKQLNVPPEVPPRGSVTGLTYLWQWVAQNTPDYLTWQCNRYLRKPIEEQKDKPSLGFRSSWKFGPQGQLVEKEGSSYMLSTMLGMTYGRGNTVPEVLNYLQRSVQADGTHPRGTIYFMKNNDIRSTVRDGLFPDAVEDLKKLGVEAKILPGTLPLNRPDVQGVCMGTSDFDWKASGSVILPGALCEHFTSWGGCMEKTDQQTPLTEFLRYGAAGASGTVTEPFATWQKFPLPQIQVHYARGCTLAEAFYQSVFGPYQLFIVGDPLCRPWANIPKVEVKGIKTGDVVKGELVLTPSGTVPRGGSIDRFELFVNGARHSQCKAGETLKLDTALLPDGSQEIRVVAVENSMIQSQGRAVYRINTNNYGRKIEVLKVPREILKTGEKLKFEVKAPGSIGVGVLHNSRLVGRIAGEEGTAEISADELGPGKVTLQAVGIGKGGPTSHVLGVPFEVEVKK